MLLVHLIKHQFHIFPLANFVEAVLWVRVDTTRGTLVTEEGEKGFEEAFSNLACG